MHPDNETSIPETHVKQLPGFCAQFQPLGEAGQWEIFKENTEITSKSRGQILNWCKRANTGSADLKLHYTHFYQLRIWTNRIMSDFFSPTSTLSYMHDIQSPINLWFSSVSLKSLNSKNNGLNAMLLLKRLAFYSQPPKGMAEAKAISLQRQGNLLEIVFHEPVWKAEVAGAKMSYC